MNSYITTGYIAGLDKAVFGLRDLTVNIADDLAHPYIFPLNADSSFEE